MAAFFQRLAKATPTAFTAVFSAGAGHSKSAFRFPIGALAAVSGAISYIYYQSLADSVYLDEVKEQTGPKVALNPDKWTEFKLQDTARVSHNTQLFRFTFDPTAKLGLHVASCLVTRAPIGQDAEGKPKYVIRPYTPISDPDSKGYFDLLIKCIQKGK